MRMNVCVCVCVCERERERETLKYSVKIIFVQQPRGRQSVTDSVWRPM